MTSPMPRDSLGRIVYAGDVIGKDTIVEEASLPYTIVAAHQSGVSTALIASFVSVDLAASPEHTNHERYFADLGTRDEVVSAFDAINCQADGISCFECPFELISGDCFCWPGWLDEKAVI